MVRVGAHPVSDSSITMRAGSLRELDPLIIMGAGAPRTPDPLIILRAGALRTQDSSIITHAGALRMQDMCEIRVPARAATGRRHMAMCVSMCEPRSTVMLIVAPAHVLEQAHACLGSLMNRQGLTPRTLV